MFSPENAYKYNCISNKQKSPDFDYPVLYTSIYSFRNKTKRRYIVNIEEYPNDVLVVKFHTKAQSQAKDKYNLLTNDNDMYRIIATVIKIMLTVFKSNPKVSFGFIGAHKVKNNYVEEKSNTLRFKIYSGLIYNQFGTKNFNHFSDIENSTYLLINKSHENEMILSESIELFTDYYPDFATN